MTAEQELCSVLLVDDHPVVRAGFKYVLQVQQQCRVLECASAEQAYSLYIDERPDVVVMDISMPGIGGFEGIRKIMAYDKQAKIIMLSVRDDPSLVSHAMGMGACGYLSKNCDPEELVQSIKQVLSGGTYLGESVSMNSIDQQGQVDLSILTKREFEVFQYITQGDSVNAIASRLNRSVKTINNHRTNIMMKLDVKNAIQLTLIAHREGLISS